MQLEKIINSPFCIPVAVVVVAAVLLAVIFRDSKDFDERDIFNDKN